MKNPDIWFADQNGHYIESLPDFIGPGLRLLSVGLNPGFRSIEAGYYFANPRNRFWAALNASGLFDSLCVPSLDANRALFEEAGIGFTDVVKRPTAGASDLRAVDFKFWAPVLKQHIERYQPRVAWFHGKVAYSRFMNATGERHGSLEWGMQAYNLGQTQFFVTPNPSPANAAFSIECITAYYRELAELSNANDE
jgi:double-stranded uracil-DNA glycosylase